MLNEFGKIWQKVYDNGIADFQIFRNIFGENH